MISLLFTIVIVKFVTYIFLQSQIVSLESNMSTECIVTVAEDSDFTLDNLPYGVFTIPDIKTGRIGVAIGAKILDLSKIHQLFDGPLMNDHKVIRGHS